MFKRANKGKISSQKNKKIQIGKICQQDQKRNYK